MRSVARGTLAIPPPCGEGGSRRRQVYAVCASLTARDSERDPGGVEACRHALTSATPALARLSPPHSQALRSGRPAPRTRMPLAFATHPPHKGEGKRGGSSASLKSEHAL